MLIVARFLSWPPGIFANSDSCPPSERAKVTRQLRELDGNWNWLPAAQAEHVVQDSDIPED